MPRLALAALGALSLAAAADRAPAQSPASGRVAVPAADADWLEVNRDDEATGYVDRRSLRLEAGRLRYVGRIVYAAPQEDGSVQIDHVGEIDCARRSYRLVAFDVLGTGGRVIGAFTPSEAEVPAEAINDGSPNARLHAEHCR